VVGHTLDIVDGTWCLGDDFPITLGHILHEDYTLVWLPTHLWRVLGACTPFHMVIGISLAYLMWFGLPREKPILFVGFQHIYHFIMMWIISPGGMLLLCTHVEVIVSLSMTSLTYLWLDWRLIAWVHWIIWLDFTLGLGYYDAEYGFRWSAYPHWYICWGIRGYIIILLLEMIGLSPPSWS